MAYIARSPNNEQQEIIDQINELADAVKLRDSFNQTFKIQGITGHLDMYGANKGTTILQEELGLFHLIATTSAALDKDGHAYIAIERISGQDMMDQQNPMFYDKFDRIIKKRDNEQLKPITEQERVKIMIQNSAIQIFDCIAGQIDRHPKNIMYDGEHFVGIDHDTAFITPEYRPVLAKTIPDEMRDVSKRGNQAIDGKSMRQYCFPPVLDLGTANAVLKVNPNNLRQRLIDETTLPQDAIDATIERLKFAQNKIKERVNIGSEEIANPRDSNIYLTFRDMQHVDRLNSYALQNYLPTRYLKDTNPNIAWLHSLNGTQDES